MASPDEGIASASTNEASPSPRPAGRTGRATAVVALAVIVGAGVVIYQNIPPRPWFPTVSVAPPPQQPQAAAFPPGPATPDGPDPADVTSFLRIAKGADGSITVAMGRPVATREVLQIQGTDQDLLFRELVRQSVLIAARDERGAATRDQLLDDAEPAEGDDPAAEVGSLIRLGFRSRMLIRPASDGRADVEAAPLLSADLAPPDNKGVGLELVGRVEELSRTEIPAALDGLGVRGKPNAYRPDAPSPEGVEAGLNSLGLVEHVRALRDLHAAVRADGESPARLEALARGYAQLGALSIHHWSAAHRAFEARSLLYAERLIAKDRGSPRGLRVRAFAEALAGVHDAAIRDLEAAARTGGAEPPPPWVEVIGAYVHYQLPKLSAIKPPHDRLAALLRMTALEFPGGSRQLIHAAQDVIRLDPDCPRAFDVISANGGLGDLHKATVLGPQSFREFLRAKLASAKDLPAGIRRALEADADDADLDRALSAAGGGEPSWGVLAHLARETRFTQARRRLLFMRDKWGVPIDEFWAAARPTIEGHPYRPYLGALTRRAEEFDDYEEFAKSFDKSDLEPSEGDFIGYIQQTPGPHQADARDDWNLAVAHSTASARDLSLVLGSSSDQAKPGVAARMMETCPNDSYAPGVLLELQWGAVQPRLAAWKERFGDSAGFVYALVKKLLQMGRHDEARPLLTRYIIMSPDRWGYEKLAECQEKAGDEAGWLETLEAYLENTEDAGLDHAGVRVKLAKFHLAKGEPEKAKPHADAAAATWASWAMECAAEVDERLGDLDSAGEWRRRMADRYPDTWTQWYLFAARTGRGDLDEARRTAAAMAMAMRPGSLEPAGAAFIDWSEGRPAQAVRLLEPEAESTDRLTTAVYIALLYDQVGDAEKRTAMARRIAEMKNRGPVTVQIAGMLFDSLGDGAKPIDLGAIDALVAPMPPSPRAFCEFLVGRFLLNRGRAEDARKRLEFCVGTAEMDPWLRAVAASWLRAAFPDEKSPPTAPEPKPAPSVPTRT